MDVNVNIVTMTIWTPDLKGHKGPRYRAIADALASDIASGRLAIGLRLPTHRDLAEALGVTVGTVSRAYAEADKRGLIRGEVGRGTFVLGGEEAGAEPSPAATSRIDMSLNLPMRDIDDRMLGATLSGIAGRRGLSGLLEYQPQAGSLRHRAAGAVWITRAGIEAHAGQVLVTSGAQHAMAVLLAALTGPADVVLAERLAYPGVRALAALLRLELRGVEIDAEGLRPDALEKACRTFKPKVLYCCPTIQNPTAAMMSESRRRKIAAIAKAHGVAIVEDDSYGMLAPERPRPLSCFAPDASFYICSLSKTIAPGLRIAYLRAPAARVQQVASAISATTWMAAPLMAEIAARWIDDGTAEASLQRKRQETLCRQELAAAVLPAGSFSSHPYSYHLWLRLQGSWRSAAFAARAWQRGVLVTPAESFLVEGEAPAAVRVCLSAPPTRAQLEQGLKILVETLRGDHDPGMSVV